jgi:hypothetical protein
VSTTPAANLSLVSITGGKFATSRQHQPQICCQCQ